MKYYFGILVCSLWAAMGLGQNLAGGTLQFNTGQDIYISCITSSQDEFVDVILRGNQGEYSTWVVTDTIGLIVHHVESPPFNLQDYNLDNFYIYHISSQVLLPHLEGTQITAIQELHALSNRVNVRKKELTKPVLDPITYDQVYTGCSGDGITDYIIPVYVPSNASIHRWLCLDTNDVIRHIIKGDTINSDSILLPKAKIVAIGYEVNVENVRVGNLITDISGCYELSDTFIQIEKKVVNGGDLSFANGETLKTICVGDNIGDAFAPIITNAIAPQYRWVFTDEKGKIEAAVSFNNFNLEGVDSGRYFIYYAAFDTGAIGLQRDLYIEDVAGCIDLSNPIELIASSGITKGGSLVLFGPKEICNGDLMPDSISFGLFGAQGDSIVYVVTTKQGIIQYIFPTDKIDLEGLDLADTMNISALSFQYGLGGLAVGKSLNTLEGCFSISNHIELIISNLDAGQILHTSPIVICANDGLADILTFETSTYQGSNSTFIIVSNDTIMAIHSQKEFDLDITMTDTAYVYHIVTDGTFNIGRVGDQFSTLQGCFAQSEPLLVLNATSTPSTGAIFLTDTDICLIHGRPITLMPVINNKDGAATLLAMTYPDGEIISLGDSTISISNTPSGSYNVWMINMSKYVQPQIGQIIYEIAGCYSLSTPINIEVELINGGVINEVNGIHGTICKGDNLDDVLSFEVTSEEGPFANYIVVDDFNNISHVFDIGIMLIDETFPPSFKVYHISFSEITGLEAGSNLAFLEGCFDLSEGIAYEIRSVNGGVLYFEMLLDTLVLCNVDTLIIEWAIMDTVGGYYGLEFLDTKGQSISVKEGLEIPAEILDRDTSIIKLWAAVDPLDQTICRAYSNEVVLINNKPKIEVFNLMGSTDICIDKSGDNHVHFDLTFVGEKAIIILYNDAGTPILFSSIDSLDLSDLVTGTYRIVAYSYFENFDISQPLGALQGCYDSVTIDVTITQLDGGELHFDNGQDSLFVCLGQDRLQVMLNGALGPHQQQFITTLDRIIVDKKIGDFFDLSSISTGEYLIYNMSAKIAPSLSIGDSLLVDDCSILSSPIWMSIEEAESQIPQIKVDSLQTTCEGTIVKKYFFSTRDTTNTNVLWVSTTTSGIVEAIHPTMPIVLDASTNHLIYAIGYKTYPTALVQGVDLSNIKACFGLSNPYISVAIHNDGGTITYSDGSNEMYACGINNFADTILVNLNTKGFVRSIWVVTDTFGIILDTFYSNTLRLDNLQELAMHIYHIAYFDRTLVPIPGQSLSEIAGCFHLSNKLSYQTSRIIGGRIMINNQDTITVCTGDATLEELKYTIENASGQGLAWILADTLDRVISVLNTAPTNLSLFEDGTCQLYHLRYDEGNFNGLNTGQNLINLQGCFDLSNAILIHKTTVAGGKLLLADSTREVSFCVDDGEADLVSPFLTESRGEQSQWIMTNVIGEITAVDAMLPFDFEGSGEGQSFIWNLSYSDNVGGLQIGGFLPDLSGCYDISSPIRVRKHVGSNCRLVRSDEIEVNIMNTYPNPASDHLYFNINLPLNFSTWKIYNAMGQVVLQGAGISKEKVINISQLDSGMYIIKLYAHDEIYQSSFIKIK